MLRQDELLSEEFSCKLCRSSSRLHGFSSAAASSSSSAFPTPLTTSFSSAAVANIDSSNGNGNNSSNNARSSFFDPAPMSVSLIEAKKNFLVNIEQIDLRERAEFEIMDEGKDDVNDVLAETTTTVNGQATDSSSSDAKVRGSPKHPTTPDQDDEGDYLSEESDPNSSSSANHSDTNYTDDEHSESDVAPAVDLEVSQKRSSSSSATKKEKEALDEKEEVVSLPAVLPEDESEFAALMVMYNALI